MQNFDYEVQPTTVKDRVYEILKREIVLGKLKPGEPINIAVLSTKLNISSGTAQRSAEHAFHRWSGNAESQKACGCVRN